MVSPHKNVAVLVVVYKSGCFGSSRRQKILSGPFGGLVEQHSLGRGVGREPPLYILLKHNLHYKDKRIQPLADGKHINLLVEASSRPWIEVALTPLKLLIN